MSCRYLIVETPDEQPRVPRCDLGTWPSRRAAKSEAARQGITHYTIVPVRRRAA